MITDFNKIVKEWAYRVDDGKPNPNNSTHLYHLSEILIENKWPFEVIDELLQNLNEQDSEREKLMKNLIYPKKIPGPWWNEILVYDTKIIDVFILDRLVKTEYEKNMITRKMKDIGVPESKWTIGKPAQYRKWFQKRDGEIERRMK